MSLARAYWFKKPQTKYIILFGVFFGNDFIYLNILFCQRRSTGHPAIETITQSELILIPAQCITHHIILCITYYASINIYICINSPSASDTFMAPSGGKVGRGGATWSSVES